MNKLTPSEFEWLPQSERKKILLLSDDMRFPSGVGTQAKEIVVGTAHRYNWVQVGAGVNHPEQGKIMDLSQAIGSEFGIKDPFVRIYPYNNYGDPFLIRALLASETPDAIMIFTDPRQFIWLFEMEHEIRKSIPIIYYNIWDSTPYPMYNRDYYRSCDALFAISKQTYNINKQVLGEDNYTLLPFKTVRTPIKLDVQKDRPIVGYLPHGINSEVFYKITDEDELKTIATMREQMFGANSNVEFVVLYNSRNLHRKMTGNVILAFNEFVKTLPEEKRQTVALVMHTHAVDGNGTDLVKIVKDCAPGIRVVFSQPGIPADQLNRIYNIADVVINLSANEGFGLGTCEAMMAERMIIANVTVG
jgi:glycosyltransferase involved in cell wall biosynthesis